MCSLQKHPPPRGFSPASLRQPKPSSSKCHERFAMQRCTCFRPWWDFQKNTIGKYTGHSFQERIWDAARRSRVLCARVSASSSVNMRGAVGLRSKSGKCKAARSPSSSRGTKVACVHEPSLKPNGCLAQHKQAPTHHAYLGATAPAPQASTCPS
mmetsp:Transcript_21598/g.32987  ORF Transcript_21598/g.32987 Transcript_21598/m.32987 type:complete len:154 (-) Transcript_21598:299-760(-)